MEKYVQLNNEIKNAKDDQRKQALINLRKIKQSRAGKKFKLVDDPTRPRCKIEVEIKK